jgi:hypothetical protein
MVAGFIAYTVMRNYSSTEPDEVATGEAPQVVAEPAEDMKAYVSASLATEIHAAMAVEHGLPDLPEGAGLLAVVGNPGEFFYTVKQDGATQVCVMRAEGPEVLWETETDKILEIVGSYGAELLLKFIDEPFTGPADAWQPGGFYGLDMFAPGVGVYPSHLDPEVVEFMRGTIR